jgi:hypothetical protein
MPATPVTCPNCRNSFSVNIEQLIDVSIDPTAKQRLLSGRLNTGRCPNCGFVAQLATPLAYHDPDKQLLTIHVPMELGLPPAEMERVIGSFTTAIQNSLPIEKRKAYLLTPRQSLTRQGLIDLILEMDGITPEMIAAQRAKMGLVEKILSTPPEQLPEVVAENDAQLDAEFFTLMLAAAESSLASGREDVAQAVVMIREQLLTLSTFGQTLLASQEKQEALITEVAERLNGLGMQVTRNDLISLMIAFAREDDEKLQAAVGLARSAFDYEFFQLLTQQMESEADPQEKQLISRVRARLTELTQMIDEQNEDVIRRATDTLRGLLSVPPESLDAAIAQRIDLLDDTFLAVLQANLQSANEARDVQSSARLKQVMDHVIKALQSTAPPSVQFLNDLMMMPSFEQVKAALQQHAHRFGPELLQWVDVLAQEFGNNPNMRNRQQGLDLLGRIRDEAERILAAPPPTGTITGELSSDRPPLPFKPNLPSDAPPTPPPAPKPVIELPTGFRRKR